MFRVLLVFICLSVGFSSFSQKNISLNSSAGNNLWYVKPQSDIGSDSIKIYRNDYSTSSWVQAVVPGTVFTSYVDAGIEKDPNFGDNIYQVDKSKYNRNFWYRTVFDSPSFGKGDNVWLHFEGVNRKGEIFLNGYRLGALDGFMERGNYEVTNKLNPSGKNVLTVLVKYPPAPIPNYQSPTYISSDGWDWMPSVPGLLSGITDDVYLSVTGGITISDPWIRTKVPDRQHGIISISANLKNNTAQSIGGKCIIDIQPGNIQLQRNFKINAGEEVSAIFDSAMYKELVILNPRLWWPNGYGDPNLYTCAIKYLADGRVMDSKEIKFGIREYAYDTLGSVFHLFINGTPVFVKGGNWGMSEYMLRCRGEEYDLKVRLHKSMHMNMIRNWIGSVTDEEFYDACDKYGIMVWDDFWLNSHPNLPKDVLSFNKNAVEKIKRLRNHASIAVWCGDNEGYPLPPLNGWLRENISAFDKNDRWYQANSHSDALTGSGPWTNFNPDWYFTKYPGGFGGNRGWGFRTEIGTAVFTTFESFKKFMPERDWWPRNEMWNKHFFGSSAGNGGPDRYEKSINENYGEATGIEDFCKKAQLLNIETNKALYEGWQHNIWNDASGVMTWMSQSAYPSFVWQTYDYYYDLNGAYWGVKKACEPIHIQWNPADNAINVINTSSENFRNITAVAEVYNMNGSLQKRYTKTMKADAPSNASTHFFNIGFTMDNLAYRKNVVASSAPGEFEPALCIADNNIGSRWASGSKDDEWVYIDLGKPSEVASVVLNWETAYATGYKILVADDLSKWKEVYSTNSGKGGVETIRFKPITARYVKMQGIKRATQWGYSLYELEVYGNKKIETGLSDVHFIKLKLTDGGGKLLSDNFYWRGTKANNYTALNNLPESNLKVSSRLSRKNGKATINTVIRNSNKSIAFAVFVQAYRSSDGERILPALMNDNYFTLLKGESKNVVIEFDEHLLPDGKYFLKVEPYNK